MNSQVNNMILENKRDFDRHLFPGADGQVFAVYEDFVLRSAFQPIYDARRQLRAYEALLRPSTLSGARTSPDKLFHVEPVNEEQRVRQINLDRLAGLMHLRNFARYRVPVPVHVNVLPASLIDGFSSKSGRSLFDERVAELGIAPAHVVFEVTEDFHADEDRMAAAVSHMRHSGYQFGVDDFGEGNSSAARVRLLAPNVIKLARRLVLRYLEGDTREVQAALELAARIQALTVAEGIETPLQFQVMSRAGLDLFQGYYLARPAPLSDFHGLPGQGARPTKTTVSDEMLII
jgi:EAL domain-containing protein (putative c-di-GMP-specific phosphodiesterase class I)